MKYNLGVTRVQDSDGNWKPVKGAWIKQADGTWAPIKTGWVKKSDGTWEQIYPTPKGILSANVSSVAYSLHQYHYDSSRGISVTNTGDYNLTVDTIQYNDSTGNFTTFPSSPNLPIVLAPTETFNLGLTVFANSVGSYSGNIKFISNTGYFGYSNVTLPVSATLLNDYNGIGTSPANGLTLLSYEYDSTTSISYNAPGTYTYTTPPGVTYLSIVITGGGGGGGGYDSHAGHTGYSGSQLTGTINVTAGDVLTFKVGGGGERGYTGGGPRGGYGGSSTASYAGGNGGSAGPYGSSGSGGGGGAGTAVYKNGNLYAIAGGGGGGGGGGDHGYGYGQYIAYSPGSSGNAGTNRTGDGGGGGGGGGGNNGGRGGGTQGGGDYGGYSGTSGTDLVPPYYVVSSANNGGYYASSGGSGAVSFAEHGVVSTATASIEIKNTGNGATLNVTNIYSRNGFFVVEGDTSFSIGYDFTRFTGDTRNVTIKSYSLPVGTYQDFLVIESDANNASIFTVPVTLQVVRPSGRAAFTTPGTYYWAVPTALRRIRMLAVAGGGAGGFGLGGSGGGGGAGEASLVTDVALVPGETVTIAVGHGGTAAQSNRGRVFPVTLNYAWNSFMNTYAVWVSDSYAPYGSIETFSRNWVAPYTGSYTLEISADNYGELYVDGSFIGSTSSFTSTATFSFSATSGSKILKINTRNDGGPAGVAAVIKNQSGTVIWTTRDVLDPAAGTAGEDTTISGTFGDITIDGGTGGSSGWQASSAIGAGSGGTGGADGSAGSTSLSAGKYAIDGGAGGNNNATIRDGATLLGPYGSGGAGGNNVDGKGSNGSSGAVVIIWGDGLG